MRPAVRRLASLTAFALGALVPLAAHAQTPTIVKPEFLLIVDTSGSMTAGTTGGTSSCGYQRTRINDAACVVRNIADGVGDAIFGLETFSMTCAPSGCHYNYTTDFSCGGTNCSVTVPGYPFPFLGCQDSAQLQVRIAENQAWEMRTWGDGSWTSCANPSGLAAPAVGGNELSNAYNTSCPGAAVSNTPLAGSLHVAWQYLANQFAASGRPSPYRNFNNTGAVDPFPACRPVSVILLTDGAETCVSGGATPAANNARNIGCLRLDLNGNGVIENPIPASDPNPTLRGKFESNIDLNGDNDCYDAGEQRAFRTNVYTIGFGIPCGDAAVEQIATGGGIAPHPVSCSASMLRGYYATNETDISDAINDIVSRSALVEVCNGVDDNCNGIVDEGYSLGTSCTAGVGACRRTGTTVCNAAGDDVRCNATPGPSAPEGTLATCSDGIDNDCDGFTDCGDPDCATQPICTGTCTPTTEICDGRDNDCDGLIDEGGISRPCGVAIGVCTVGTETCVQQPTPRPSGTWGACTGRGPSAEICDGLDNNCNGVADEGLTRACGTMVGACRAGVQQCVSGSFSGPCIGSVGPSTEVCDGIDNDCNGMVDDAIPPGGSCGAAGVGVCTAGTIQCMGGRLVCVGGRMPGPEVCNNLDDDCNGAVDDGIASMACTPAGIMFPTTPPMGACRQGTTRCVAGMTVCEGAVGPSPETCNGLDDNCNGMIDEGLPSGMACGIMVGVCRVGTMRCVMGREVCEGSVMPMAEVCNGVDDNCNGEVDEGNPGGGAACGSAVGACRPGRNVCRGGMVVCEGAVGPTPETCNGVDDDCNGMIDDGIPSGTPCGSSVGECRPGTQRCVGGRMVCEGARGPSPEECDCRDNDCDGMVDNMATGGSPLCGGDSVCAGAPSCACLRPCNDSEFPCPVGRRCEEIGGRRLCVGDPCATVTCANPNDICTNGECRSRCQGVTCEAPLVCNPRDGRCVSNSCRVLENCPMGQICRMDACVNDPCAGVTCPAGQACYGVAGDGGAMLTGVCAPSCAGVTCPAGQACVRGVCQGGAVSCANVTCPMGQACNPSNGMCGPDLCANRRCTRDQACDPATGMCVDDPCAIVRCPTGQTCSAGECREPPAPPSAPRDRVIGSGGGGFGGCSVGAGSATQGAGSMGTVALAVMGLALGSVLSRRRKRRGEDDDDGAGDRAAERQGARRDGGEVR